MRNDGDSNDAYADSISLVLHGAADLDGNGSVGFADLTRLLAAWGACDGACLEDLDRSCDVGFADLTNLLSAWS